MDGHQLHRILGSEAQQRSAATIGNTGAEIPRQSDDPAVEQRRTSAETIQFERRSRSIEWPCDWCPWSRVVRVSSGDSRFSTAIKNILISDLRGQFPLLQSLRIVSAFDQKSKWIFHPRTCFHAWSISATAMAATWITLGDTSTNLGETLGATFTKIS